MENEEEYYFFVSFMNNGGFGNITYVSDKCFPSKEQLEECIKKDCCIQGRPIILNIQKLTQEECLIFNS